MCGICGIVDSPERAPDLERSIEAMVRALGHRGPDGRGSSVLGPPAAPKAVALGHTRLAIIDLSEAGRQPMSGEGGRVHMVFNGEVYNYRRLRKALEAKGLGFRSQTDTEVVLRLYEDRGLDFVRDLEGMFALGILDLAARRLVLARDPIGVKPLYYAEGPGWLVFGSEIKAVLASHRGSVEPDWQAIWDYFTFLYIPCPETAFRGIRQLPPAHLLTLDLDGGATVLSRYWRPRRLPDVAGASFGDAKALLRERLEATVRDQIVSDVPIGVFLSSGPDSTVVAGLAAKANRDIRSYTVVFDDPALAAYDERAGARAISRHLGMPHEELSVSRIDPFDLLDTLPFFDQPFGNPTAHLMYLLSHCARPHITVALCGAGGDELFAGYPRYRAEAIGRWLRGVPASLLRAVGRGLARIPDTHRSMSLRRIKEFFAGWDADPAQRFTNWTYFLDEPTKASLLGASRGSPSVRLIRDLLGDDTFPKDGSRLLHLDVQTFLPGNLLEYTDRASMAVGLEVRVPLLDHHFVETSLNLAYGHKVRRLRTKVVFREAFPEFFPPEVLRLPKRGFNAPLALWARTLDAYFDAADDPAHPLHARFGNAVGVTWRTGLLSRPVIQRLRAEHRRGVADHSYELFGIIQFDRWWSTYVEKVPPQAAYPG